MDERSSVTMLKDVLGFKLSRRKFENGRLGVWKMEVNMENGSVVVTYVVNSILAHWK